MSKKLITFLFAVLLCLCFALAACFENPDGDKTGDNESNTEQGDGIGSEESEEITEMYITINGNKMKVTLARNSTVDALVELLKQDDITYTANDYGGFEKVGGLGHTLPTNHVQTVTEPGDIVLYQTNQIVMFYGSNSWNYTRIGKINYSSQTELESFLGAGQGNVQVTISLK